MPPESILTGAIKRLYILDYGLFQVTESGRIIGIPGYLIQTDEGVNIREWSSTPVPGRRRVKRRSGAEGL